ncbi:hypothetical protein B0T17DRAFT_615126 [Bombardia bombarda]|uniref:Uncharacterized protein n=1 Tax=Bombardia bombarda TaxID=252184 RepID=A0AA39X8N3_9PEZI|nr:hypothetical protein B0T17DRAFT_615126 [Bombardia bombarda]
MENIDLKDSIDEAMARMIWHLLAKGFWLSFAEIIPYILCYAVLTMVVVCAAKTFITASIPALLFLSIVEELAKGVAKV